MKILLTGVSGQLGKELLPKLQEQGHEVIAVTREDMDLSQPEQVLTITLTHQPDCIINCAAYTQVDQAESDADTAYRVNGKSAEVLAQAAKQIDAKLIHISTDYVFDGRNSLPYQEDHATNPLSIYGKSKLQGEQLIQAVNPNAIILRTSWVYGAHGNNFVKTMLKLAAEREQLTIVDDQIGTPSWTADISRCILSLISQPAEGIFHFTNEGITSWYDFAVAIFEEARLLGFQPKTQQIKPIPTSQFPRPAQRPAYSVLSKQKIRSQLNYAIPHWRTSLKHMLMEILK